MTPCIVIATAMSRGVTDITNLLVLLVVVEILHVVVVIILACGIALWRVYDAQI